MQKDQIAAENHIFLVAAVAAAVYTSEFMEVVLSSFDDFSQHEIEKSTYPGCIIIDTAAIEDDPGPFIAAVLSGILPQVAMRIPSCIKGAMNTEVQVIWGGFVFRFRIDQYERGGQHGFGMISKPAGVPRDERLGRCVSLRIEPNKNHQPDSKLAADIFPTSAASSAR